MEQMTPRDVIRRIADAANSIAWQAGVGGMETAGGIVSFLAANPQHIDKFMADGSVIDLPADWHRNGCLTWHGMDGKLHQPGEQETKQ